MKKWITIACLLLIVCQTKTLAAFQDDMKFQLLRQLNQAADGDTTRLNVLFELVQVTKTQPQVRLYYIDLLLKEAEEQNNNKYKCQAYLSRIYVAYNMYDAAEVKRWAALLEPLARKEKLYDLLFMGKQCAIDFLAFGEEYELAEKQAFRMLKEAQELKSDKGVIVAYQCLANVYQMTYRHEEGIEILLKAYELAVNIDDYLLGNEVNRFLIDTYESLDDKVNLIKRIEIQEEHIASTLRRHPEQEASFGGSLLMVAIARLNYYTGISDFVQAERALQRAIAANDGQLSAYSVRFHTACNSYYRATDQFEKALVETDILIKLFEAVSAITSNSLMCQKAYLLNKLGRYDESLELYKTSGIVKDSIQLSVLNKQTGHLRQNYNADTLMLKQQRINRYVQISSILLIGIIIAVFIYFVVRAYRVRNHLRASENAMRVMAQEMERMNQTKERFLSSISSGISQPLNDIVAGSLQLASDVEIDDEQRKKLSESIDTTSALLMKLINNILDLSRFESGMMKYSLSEIELTAFIHSLVASTSSQHPALTVHLPTEKQITIETDVNRLTELFMRLLSKDDAPSNDSAELTLELTLSDTEQELRCTVLGTVLAGSQTQEMVVMNEINRLFVEHFGGTYQVVTADRGAASVAFTLPVVSSKK